jgi:hypothetical protein
VILDPKRYSNDSKITWNRSIPIPVCLSEQFPSEGGEDGDYVIGLDLLCRLCEVALLFGTIERVDKANSILTVRKYDGVEAVHDYSFTYLSVDDYPFYETDLGVYAQSTNFFDIPVILSKKNDDNYRLVLVSLATCLEFWNVEGEDPEDALQLQQTQKLEEQDWPVYTNTASQSNDQVLDEWNPAVDNSFLCEEVATNSSWNMDEVDKPNTWKDELIVEVEAMRDRRKRRELRRRGNNKGSEHSVLADVGRIVENQKEKRADGEVRIDAKESDEKNTSAPEFMCQKSSFYCPKTFSSLPGEKYATTELYRLENELDASNQSKPKYYPLPSPQSNDSYFCLCLVDNASGLFVCVDYSLAYFPDETVACCVVELDYYDSDAYWTPWMGPFLELPVIAER